MADEQRLLEQLETEAAAERKQITEKAEAEAKRITEEAQQEADRRVEAARLRGEKRGIVEVDRRVGMAGQEVGFAVLVEKHAVLASVREDVAARIGNIRERKEYGEALSRWTHEVLAGLGEGATLVVSPADSSAVKKAVVAAGGKVEIKTDKAVVGGVKAQSADGRVLADNTLGSRFARAQERLDEVLGRALFGED